MKKYRIVKVVSPELTQNHNCVADFVPKIKWKKHFRVEEKRSFFSSWEIIWDECSIEQARVLKEHATLKTSKCVIE